MAPVRPAPCRDDLRGLTRAHERAEQAGYTVVRNYVGEYCTSLEMAGASLTILRLDGETEELLAAPAEVAVRIF